MRSGRREETCSRADSPKAKHADIDDDEGYCYIDEVSGDSGGEDDSAEKLGASCIVHVYRKEDVVWIPKVSEAAERRTKNFLGTNSLSPNVQRIGKQWISSGRNA